MSSEGERRGSIGFPPPPPRCCSGAESKSRHLQKEGLARLPREGESASEVDLQLFLWLNDDSLNAYSGLLMHVLSVRFVCPSGLLQLWPGEYLPAHYDSTA